VILTNGPGEVAAWVKPVVTALRQHTNKHFSDIRISVCFAWLLTFFFFAYLLTFCLVNGY
jgi:hypothetical protein